MAYEYDNDDDAYEMMDDGAVVKSPAVHHQQQVHVHRSGSIDINSLNNNNNNAATATKLYTSNSAAAAAATSGYEEASQLQQQQWSVSAKQQHNHSAAPSYSSSSSAAAGILSHPTTSTREIEEEKETVTSKLGSKIRRQAIDLQRMQRMVDETNEYARLCEARVLDLHPSHPLPITEDSLGVNSPNGIRSSGRRSGGGGGGGGGSGGSSGVVAKLKREKVELESANTALEKQLMTSRSKASDRQNNLKEMRHQSSQKDKELDIQKRKILNLSSKVMQLENDLRAEREVLSAASTKMARSPPAAAASSEQRAADRADVEAANNKVEHLRNENNSLRTSLQNEARTSEEQRVYIAVLESAVQSKASEMGLGQGEAALLTKMARLQGELSAKSREAEQSEMQLRAFEVEMEDIRVREEQQENVTNEQNQKIQALSERLTQFGRGEDDLLNSVKSLESEKTALLDYVEDNATRVADLSHQLQMLSGEKLDWEKDRLDLERAHRTAITDTTATVELLQIKVTEHRAAYNVATKDCDEIRVRLSVSLQRTSELEEEVTTQTHESSELRSVQNELLENLREKTSATSATTREIAMLRREKGASDGTIAVLESKISTLQVRMDAQKDLLRGDQKAATDALEEQLRKAISDAEEQKRRARMTRDELETMEDELEREREIVIELSELRDELVQERDEQTSSLNELGKQQEETERTLEDAMTRLESAEEELTDLRSIKEACDRLTSSLRGMSQRDLSGKTTDDVADAYASDFSEWCLNDATSRQLRLSTMTSMAEGVSNLGRRFLRSLDRYQSEKSDKVVLTRTLQDEIHGLRQRNEGLDEDLKRTTSDLNEMTQRTEEMADDLHETREELRETRSELDGTTIELSTTKNKLQKTQHSLVECTNDFEGVTTDVTELEREREEKRIELSNVSNELERLREHAAELESNVELLSQTNDSLRLDVEQSREDATSLQREHRSDRQVFQEKIRTAEHQAAAAKLQEDEHERTRLHVESELVILTTRLEEETDGRERYSGESLVLRNRLDKSELELRRALSELDEERRKTEAVLGDSDAAVTNLENRLRTTNETKISVESLVMSLTTEIESLRRTLSRSVDDVCDKYGRHIQPVSDFIRGRATSHLSRSRSLSPSSRGLSSSSSSSSSSSLATSVNVEGARNAARDMSTLLHALASTSVAIIEEGKRETSQHQTKIQDTEHELRRAQDLLSQARRQHDNVLTTTQSELTKERERTRQMDLVVRQLRDVTVRTGQTNGEMSSRVDELERELERQLSSHRTETISLQNQLSTSRKETEREKEETMELKRKWRESTERCERVERELEELRGEMAGLEETVSTELGNLSEVHAAEVERGRHHKERMELLDEELKQNRGRLVETSDEMTRLKREMLRKEEDYEQRVRSLEGAHAMELEGTDARQQTLTLQLEECRARSDSVQEALRTELSSAEATVGMLREQNEQLMEERREATAEASRASDALNGQESLSRAEHAQNEILSHRVESLESELQRVRRLAAERSLVASNRSMEISELRGSLSRVEQAVNSPPKELPLQTPGYETNQGHNQGRVHINRMGSVTFNNTGSAFRGGGGSGRTTTNNNEPIRAMPLASIASMNGGGSSSLSSSSSSSSSVGPVQVHVSRRGSIDIASTPVRGGVTSSSSLHSTRIIGPSPAAQRVRDRLANVRAQFASLRN